MLSRPAARIAHFLNTIRDLQLRRCIMKTIRKIFRRHKNQDRKVTGPIETLEGRRLLSTYYAAPTGSDSAAGTINAPFASLSKAVSTAKAGDTIILRGGTYAGNVTIN